MKIISPRSTLLKLPFFLSVPFIALLLPLHTSVASETNSTRDHSSNPEERVNSDFNKDDDSYTDLDDETEEEFDEADTELDEDFIYEDAFSDDVYTDTRFFFSIDALYGGKSLNRVYFTNGEGDSLRAGTGISFSLGIAHLLLQKKMDVGIKAGYLFNTITAKNSLEEENELSFSRKPIDIFTHYWVNRHSFGGGLTAHIDPKFTTEHSSNNQHYKNAYGAYLEYMFFFPNAGSALGIKYLNISYENQKTQEITEANSWGITFSQLF